MKAVINYFNRTELVSSVNEAVKFVNSLQYRGNSHQLSCSENCKKNLEKFFEQEYVAQRITTTGCSTTYINIYKALADTLEEHNKIVADQKEESDKKAKEKAEARHEQWMSEMLAPAKGWYVVTLDVLISKIKGNDGTKTYSFRILAENQMNAYEKACNLAMQPGGIKDRNISFVYQVQDSAKSALIEYVGEWTDESELEYGSSK